MTVSAPGLTHAPAMESTVAQARRGRLPNTLRRHPRLAIGGGLVLILVLVAIFAPLLTPYDPIVGDVVDGLQPPSAAHWLGTDDLGRDVMARVLFGARLSLSVALISVAIGVGVGVSI